MSRRVNITLDDDEYSALMRSYKRYIRDYIDDEPPLSLTGYAGALLHIILKEEEERNG